MTWRLSIVATQVIPSGGNGAGTGAGVTPLSGGGGDDRPIPRRNPRSEVILGLPPWEASVWYDTLATHARRMVQLHGDALLDAMLAHPTIRSAIDTFKAAVLADGVQINPSVQVDDDPDSNSEIDPEERRRAELAGEVAAYCQRATDALEQPLEAALWELLDAIPRGCMLAEVTWRLASSGPDAGFHVLDSVRCKPRSVWNFLVDERGRVVGIEAHAVRDGRRRQQQTVQLPRRKVAIFSWAPRAGDPRGTPALEAVYEDWNFDVLLRPEAWKFAENFAAPFLFGTTAEGAEPYTDDNGVLVDPQQAMLQGLLDLPRKKAAVAKAGAKVDVISAGGDGQVFGMLKQQCRVGMVEGLLAQARTAARLAAGPDDADSPQDDFQYLVRVAKAALEAVVRRDIYRPLVADRYGEAVAEWATPLVKFGRIDLFYFSRVANAMARLNQTGAVPPSALPRMWGDILGFPRFLSAADVEPLIERQRLELEALRAQIDATRADADAEGDAEGDIEPEPEPVMRPTKRMLLRMNAEGDIEPEPEPEPAE